MEPEQGKSSSVSMISAICTLPRESRRQTDVRAMQGNVCSHQGPHKTTCTHIHTPMCNLRGLLYIGAHTRRHDAQPHMLTPPSALYPGDPAKLLLRQSPESRHNAQAIGCIRPPSCISQARLTLLTANSERFAKHKHAAERDTPSRLLGVVVPFRYF